MKNINVYSPECSPENVSLPPPPPPPVKSNSGTELKKSTDMLLQKCNSFASKATRDSWDRMFDEAHGADVLIHTDDNGLIYAHSNVIVSSLYIIRNLKHLNITPNLKDLCFKICTHININFN